VGKKKTFVARSDESFLRIFLPKVIMNSCLANVNVPGSTWCHPSASRMACTFFRFDAHDPIVNRDLIQFARLSA